MYKITDLDKRICDIEEGATNTETLTNRAEFSHLL